MIGKDSIGTSPLRGALIGCGNVALHAHLPLWKKNGHFRIDAILDTLPEQVKVANDLLPDARVYSEMASLLAGQRLDFVDICTPPCFHGELILAACQAGLHVFCEKPLITSLDHLRLIQRAAKKSQKVIFTVNNWKYAPLWIKTLEIVRENKIGTVKSIDLTVLRPPNSGGGASNWRKCAEIAGGGILLDHGWHHLYLILSVIKEQPLFVSAQMEYSKTNGSNLDETVNLILQFHRVEARLHLTWQASCRKNFGTITGDQGTLFLNDDHLILEPKCSSPIRYDFSASLSGSSHHLDWMEPVMEEFLHEVLIVGARGENIKEATACATLINLAYQSYRQGSCLIPVGDPVTQESACC